MALLLSSLQLDNCKNDQKSTAEYILHIKGAAGSADLKISKSALLSLNHHNVSNTEPIYTE